jgi:hypothetical protein
MPRSYPLALRARPVSASYHPPMSARPLRLRLLAVLVALVQLVGPATAAIADAQLQAESVGPQAASHIESHRRPECAHVHADDCFLCQYLSAGAGQPSTPALPVVAAVVGAPYTVRVVAATATTFAAIPRPRAPPSLVMLEAWPA